MYIVTVSPNCKMTKQTDNLYFRGNKTSFPLDNNELAAVLVRIKGYIFKDRIFDNATGMPIGTLEVNVGATKVELEPIEIIKLPRTPRPRKIKIKKIITRSRDKGIKPVELVTFKEAEKLLIEKALTYCKGNQTQAGKLLKISDSTVRARIRKYKISLDLLIEVELSSIRPIRESEKYLLELALKYTRGNKQESAKLLGISPRGIQNKIYEYNVDAKCYLE